AGGWQSQLWNGGFAELRPLLSADSCQRDENGKWLRPKHRPRRGVRELLSETKARAPSAAPAAFRRCHIRRPSALRAAVNIRQSQAPPLPPRATLLRAPG